MGNAKKILLIDLDDPRRESRVRLLTHAGYIVDLRLDHIEAQRFNHEGTFDLVIVAVSKNDGRALQYSNELSKANSDLPILLLIDSDVYVPPGTLSKSIETGYPAELITAIAVMLAGSAHIRELPIVTE